MGKVRLRISTALLAGGLVAFAIALLSIADMFVSRPYDGVVLEADAYGKMVVREVGGGGGAGRAGLRPGDQIVGIDRTVLRAPGHAAQILNRRQIGDRVPYLVRGSGGLREVWVELGRRHIGSPAYAVACLLGFAFFFIGVLVLHRQPRLRAAQVFFLLSTLFLLFLVCRLRPASYTWVDSFVLSTGTLAILLLPACFLHFFLIFPRPVRLRPQQGEPDYRRRRRFWVSTLWLIYLLPPAVFVASRALAALERSDLELISGAPAQNWWALAAYMLAGMGVLAAQGLRLRNPRERSGVLLVFFGFLFGLVPFLATAVFYPAGLHRESVLLFGLAPLVLVPSTFAYAIIRFQLLDIRIILRKSLLYTATTAVVTVLYAAGIALFNAVFSGTRLADSPLFPLVLALAIVLLFEPLRRRIQVLVDRYFFAERSVLEAATRQVRDALMEKADVHAVVSDLVQRLPTLLGLEFAALYLARDGELERAAGPESLPQSLAPLPEASGTLARGRGLARLGRLLKALPADDGEGSGLAALEASGVELVGDLSTPRRTIGWMMLSGKRGQFSFDAAELELLRGLLQQAALALETALLLEERTRQAEMERELEIAALVQSELLPRSLSFAPGWRVAALCRPARQVGGDFFTQLPGPIEGTSALVYGDVAGKSVSGALLMMAAHEALHSLALSHIDPERLLDLANRRLYGLGKRKSFVALAYLASAPDGSGVDYVLAGQPQPLLRRSDGAVEELALPENRLPLGALVNGGYRLCHAPMAPGDLVLGYSDGVVEARSPSGELFGSERLARVVADATGEPEEVVERVLRALEEFTQGSEPYDDVTLVAIACDREEQPCGSSTLA